VGALLAYERRRLVLALHDGTQQRLVVLLAWLSELAGLIDDDPSSAKALVSRLEGETEAAIQELRALVHGIQPAELADIGLVGALRAIARSSPVPARVSTHGVGRYDPATEDAVYFACREAVQNTIKHAPEATAITITLIDHDEWLEFRIQDDGPGCSAVSAETGLASLRHRIAASGGTLEVHATSGAGTQVHGTIPVPLAGERAYTKSRSRR
jgi:signal transduction histidine kinase